MKKPTKDLKSRLASYSALSGAFVLAGSHDAEAQIVYVDVEPDFVLEALAEVDADGSSGSYFSPYAYINAAFNPVNGSFRTNTTTTGSGEFYLRASAGVRGYYWNFGSIGSFTSRTIFSAYAYASADSSNVLGSGEASRLNSGSIVDSGTFSGELFGSIERTFGGFDSDGNFASSGVSTSSETGFIGFQFEDGGETKYGWMRITVDLDVEDSGNFGSGENVRESVNTRAIFSSSASITVHDYAYQDTPDTPIPAGETGASTAIPTMGQWGLIALNLMLMIFGIVAVRDRKKLVFKKK